MAKQASKRTTRARKSRAKSKNAEAKAGVAEIDGGAVKEKRSEKAPVEQAQPAVLIEPTVVIEAQPAVVIEGEREEAASTEAPSGTVLEQLMRNETFRARVIARVVKKLR